jgi:hypothetical protein
LILTGFGAAGSAFAGLILTGFGAAGSAFAGLTSPAPAFRRVCRVG